VGVEELLHLAGIDFSPSWMITSRERPVWWIWAGSKR
jgi:hypothetical protein